MYEFYNTVLKLKNKMLEASTGMTTSNINKNLLDILSKSKFPMSAEEIYYQANFPQLSQPAIKAYLSELETAGKVKVSMKKGVAYYK